MSPDDPFESALLNAWPSRRWSNVTVCIGVSGGADSIALLHALHAARPPSAAGSLIVAHFNHGWRGEESDRDEQFTRETAQRLGLQFISERAAAVDQSRSEETARRLRYSFLLRAASQCGARYVAVAHNANDQAETILFRLLRGTGLSGLSGMPRCRKLSDAVTLIRPLLDISREDILNYLARHQLSYRDDASNRDLRYARNRLRHQLLPHLARFYNPRFADALRQVGQQADDWKGAIAPLVERFIVDHVVPTPLGFRLPQDAVAQQPDWLLLEAFISLWIRQRWPRREMSRARWRELLHVARHSDASRMFPGELRAVNADRFFQVFRDRKQ